MKRFESIDAIESDEGMYVLHDDAQSRIAELEAEVARLSDELQAKGKDNHIYREGKLAGFANGWDRAIDAAAIVLSKSADLANEAGRSDGYVMGIQSGVTLVCSLKREEPK